MAKFSNHPSGHKALIAHLLRSNRQVRVCLEASGNYSLDLALTLQAHHQVEISVINPRRARRFARLRREALRIIARDSELDRRFRLMLTTTGIAETSALQILGELAVLPDILDARQWVAFSGLDPRLFKPGKSVEKRPRISSGW